jgi:molecular chaperone GrpE
MEVTGNLEYRMRKKHKIQDEPIIHIKEYDLHRLKEESKRVKEMESHIEKLDAQILDIKDRYLRTAAEFDNYKKRTEKEKQEIFRFGTENLVMQLLPFDDIFEGVIKQMEKTPSSETIHKGLEMLKSEFTKLLNCIGVKKIETVGKMFDPKIHEASETVETSKHKEGTIIEEERSGYLLHDKVLRPALVKVAKKPEVKMKNDESSVTSKD